MSNYLLNWPKPFIASILLRFTIRPRRSRVGMSMTSRGRKFGLIELSLRMNMRNRSHMSRSDRSRGSISLE